MDFSTLFNLELLEFFNTLEHQGMIGLVTQAAKRQDRIDHRRKNRPQTIGIFQPGDHPFFRLLYSEISQRLDPGFFELLEHQVDRRENITPAENRLGVPAEAAISLLVAVGDGPGGFPGSAVIPRADALG